jgi:D-alanyl-D-alanine carboxypeptidase (penicillin-binding protein 5/6)
MKAGRWGSWVVVVTAILAPSLAMAGVMEPPRVTAKAAIVVDAHTGSVLWSLSPDERLPPASTTKVMTAILALESGRLRDRVEASPEARMVARARSICDRTTVAARGPGHAILLNSANDASIAIAEHLANSVDAFGERMTARPSAGATRTNFLIHTGSPGWPFTTARDLTISSLRAGGAGSRDSRRQA